MSEVKVNKISPRSGTTVTLGDSGDTITLASGVSLTGVNATFSGNATVSGDLTVDTDTLYVDSANNRVGVGTATPSITFDAEASGATVAHFNRTTSDGDIVELQKDGTTVGSIASVDGNSIMIGDGNTNLRFYAPANIVLPADSSGSNQPNVVSLGNASSTFKDLYLGGNIYLGGTTSANALDDYETGTWTPTYTTETSSFTSITLDADNRGFYTKIGDVVVAQCRLLTDGITVGGASGDVYVDGFPFTVAVEDNAVHTAGGGIGLSKTFAGDVPTSYFCIRNDTKALLQYRTSANGDTVDLQVTDLDTGTNKNQIIATFIYKAQ